MIYQLRTKSNLLLFIPPIVLYTSYHISRMITTTTYNKKSCQDEFLVNNLYDNYTIPCKLWKSSHERAVVIFMHGGMFAKGDVNSHATISKALVDLGLVVITATFRCGSEAPHRTNKTMEDLFSVVKYIQSTYNNVPFGLVGSSSGGFFALQYAFQYFQNDISFVIPICPVSHPYQRAQYLRNCITKQVSDYHVYHTPEKAKVILDHQLSYFETDKVMQVSSEVFKTNVHQIPTLLIIGSDDKNVPHQVTQNIQNWATRTIVIGGVGHEIQNEPIASDDLSYLPDINRFITHLIE